MNRNTRSLVIIWSLLGLLISGSILSYSLHTTIAYQQTDQKGYWLSSTLSKGEKVMSENKKEFNENIFEPENQTKVRKNILIDQKYPWLSSQKEDFKEFVIRKSVLFDHTEWIWEVTFKVTIWLEGKVVDLQIIDLTSEWLGEQLTKELEEFNSHMKEKMSTQSRIFSELQKELKDKEWYLYKEFVKLNIQE